MRVSSGSYRIVSNTRSKKLLLAGNNNNGDLAAHLFGIQQCDHSTRAAAAKNQPHSRWMSTNLLGYSPMAAQVINTNANVKAKKESPSGPSFGVDSNTAGGGVWAQTSARQSKLADLKLELKHDKGQYTLELAATAEEKQDLYLVHGLNVIAQHTDQGWDAVSNAVKEETTTDVCVKHPNDNELSQMTEYLDKLALDCHIDSHKDKLESVTYNTFLTGVAQKAEVLLSKIDTNTNMEDGKTEKSASAAALLHVRDIFHPTPLEHMDKDVTLDKELRQLVVVSPSSDVDVDADDVLFDKELAKEQEKVARHLQTCVVRFRLIMVAKAAEQLAKSWDSLTKLTDSDVDRAAVDDVDVSDVQQKISLSQTDVVKVLQAYATGTCADRIEALWKLTDHDGDGMLDQEEMDQVVYMSIDPVKDALRLLTNEVVMGTPVRSSGSTVTEDTAGTETKEPKKSFLQRRREARLQKRLLKFSEIAYNNHFDREVEIPHRLRCAYAWADKQHQNGEIKSVLVDSAGAGSSGTAGFGGRKRYVEFHPKISYQEFRTEQNEFFDHLDRVGEELLKSFRDEILLHQGTGRQNKDARNEVGVFFVILLAADVLLAFS
jgi:hypothetical protein